MSYTEYELVARIGKARGLEGEVTATRAGDLPFSVYEGLHVHVVPPTLYGKRELTVATVGDASGSTHLLSFEEIDSIDEAEQLAGHYLLADVADLEGVIEDPSFLDIGRAVIDERYGELGEVTEVIETPANDVWVVEGPYGEVLLPIIDDIVIEYSQDEAKPISVRVMDGLIDG